MSSNINIGDQPCVCITCKTRNYEVATHCRGCGIKIKAGPGPYLDRSKITLKVRPADAYLTGRSWGKK